MKLSNHAHIERCGIHATYQGTFPCKKCDIEYFRCQVSREVTGRGTGHCDSDYYCPQGHMVG